MEIDERESKKKKKDKEKSMKPKDIFSLKKLIKLTNFSVDWSRKKMQSSTY